MDVLEISLEDGIKEKGRIEMQRVKEFVEPIDRTIYIEDNLYSINNEHILINKIDTLQEINRVNI